jgi:hypothetical protein
VTPFGCHVVNPDAPGLFAPIKIIERPDDLITRFDFGIGRDGILQIAEDVVGKTGRGFLEHRFATPRD